MSPTEPSAPATLRLSDFVLDPASGIRFADAGPPAGYLDGAEMRLLEALATVEDRSVASDELASLIEDWPTLYHLTPYRTTLFDAFGWTGAAAKVLELGAGCGAITRWLGEHTAEVHAIEGDATRAAVARARTADQEHVAIYAGNFSGLDAQDFDLVTLIGVLEYGHLYHPEHGDDPEAAALANLTMARRSLVDDGVLVLAIENRLGLKYFNGAPEDHSAKPYESVQGYPHATGAVTFNARVLERLVAEAGFAAQDWFLPFPDYKLATTIVNDARVAPEHRIHNWISSPAPGRGVERVDVPFNETLAFREAAAAGLLRDLSNSFLVLAYADPAAAGRARLGLDTDWVARHWSLDRKAAFRKRVSLRQVDSDLVVDHEPTMGRSTTTAGEGTAIRQTLAREPFRRGDLELVAVHETLAAEGAGERFLDHVRALRDHLLASHGTGLVDPSGLPLLDGRAVDVTWWNLAREPRTGALEALDEEFALELRIPADWVVWRTLRHLVERHGPHLPPSMRDVSEFAAAWTMRVLPDVTADRIGWLSALEQELGRLVGPAGAIPVPDVDPFATLAEAQGVPAVLAFAEEIAERPELLSAYAASPSAAQPALVLLYAPGGEPDALVARLTAVLDALELARQLDLLLLLHPPADEVDVRAVAARCVAMLGDHPRLAGTGLTHPASMELGD